MNLRRTIVLAATLVALVACNEDPTAHQDHTGVYLGYIHYYDMGPELTVEYDSGTVHIRVLTHGSACTEAEREDVVVNVDTRTIVVRPYDRRRLPESDCAPDSIETFVHEVSQPVQGTGWTVRVDGQEYLGGGETAAASATTVVHIPIANPAG